VSEELERDIIHEWTLERGNHHTTHRFRLRCTVTSPFLEPTRHEVRDALAQVLDEALGLDPVESDIGDWVAETSELLYSEEVEVDFTSLDCDPAADILLVSNLPEPQRQSFTQALLEHYAPSRPPMVIFDDEIEDLSSVAVSTAIDDILTVHPDVAGLEEVMAAHGWVRRTE
jgi:hypothetical protein